jgi:type II secretory pathway component PulF
MLLFMKYYEATLIARGKREVHNYMAADRKEAMAIAQSGGMVIQVREVGLPLGERLVLIKDMLVSKLTHGAPRPQEWIVAMRQMGVMLQAGMSLSDALGESANATQDKRGKMILLKALEDVEAGFSLTASFEKSKEGLGSITMALVTLGEKTGTLAESLLKLADMLEELRLNQMKVKKAVRTPQITLTAMAIAFVVLIMMVVPKFESVFRKMKADLPAPTQFLIGTEYAFRNYGLLIVAVIFLIYFSNNWMLRNRRNYRLWFDRVTLRVYLIGSLMSLGFYQRFMMIFSQLITSGIPLTDAMATASGTIDNEYVKLKLAEASRGIGQGKQLSTALEETALFEPMVLQMIRSGESSGELDGMLSRVADYYRMRFNNLVDNFAALLEPILMVFIAGLVLVMALGIFLPMWSLGSAVKTKK